MGYDKSKKWDEQRQRPLAIMLLQFIVGWLRTQFVNQVFTEDFNCNAAC